MKYVLFFLVLAIAVLSSFAPRPLVLVALGVILLLAVVAGLVHFIRAGMNTDPYDDVGDTHFLEAYAAEIQAAENEKRARRANLEKP